MKEITSAIQASLLPMPGPLAHAHERPRGAAITRAAKMSDDLECRFLLAHGWAEGKRVFWLGLNPSTADARRDDLTTHRWDEFAWQWGYGNWVAGNLYPKRTSSPKICERWYSERDFPENRATREALQQNILVVVAAAKEADIVVACWGSGNWDNDWSKMMTDEIQHATGKPIHALMLSAAGCPMHPLARGKSWISNMAQPIIWIPAK